MCCSFSTSFITAPSRIRVSASFKRKAIFCNTFFNFLAIFSDIIFIDYIKRVIDSFARCKFQHIPYMEVSLQVSLRNMKLLYKPDLPAPSFMGSWWCTVLGQPYLVYLITFDNGSFSVATTN